MKRSTKSKKKQSFVFIVDSHDINGTLRNELEKIGLAQEKDFHITGAGGADYIMTNFGGRRIADTENLLVIMSTFHGSLMPAVDLCKRVKEVNPKARFIFRSTISNSSDPLFELCLGKGFEDNEKLLVIIKKFFKKNSGISTR